MFEKCPPEVYKKALYWQNNSFDVHLCNLQYIALGLLKGIANHWILWIYPRAAKCNDFISNSFF